MSRRRKMDKSQSERIHFKRRLRQRYGLRINRSQYRSIRYKVKSGLSQHVYTQSNTRTVHRIPYQGYNILAVYDTKRGELVTALDPTLTEEQIRNYKGD